MCVGGCGKGSGTGVWEWGWKGMGSGVEPYRLDTMAGTSLSSSPGEADLLSLSSSSTVKAEGRGALGGASGGRGGPLGPAGHTAAVCWYGRKAAAAAAAAACGSNGSVGGISEARARLTPASTVTVGVCAPAPDPGYSVAQ